MARISDHDKDALKRAFDDAKHEKNAGRKPGDPILPPDESRIIELLDRYMAWEEPRERRRKCKRLIDYQTKIDPDEKPLFPLFQMPGFAPEAYNREQWIRDDAGQVDQYAIAAPAFFNADAARQMEHASAAMTKARFGAERARRYTTWALEEMEKEPKYRRPIQFELFAKDRGFL